MVNEYGVQLDLHGYAPSILPTDGCANCKREANRWAELRLMERAGKIQKLKRQVKYLLIPSQYRDGKCIERECCYLADFTYIKDGRLVVEDCKGFRTPEYKIKRKLMLQLYDIRLVET